MAGFIVRERKVDPNKPSVPKEFKSFSIPSVKIDSLEEADALIELYKEFGSTDVVQFLQMKTKKFR